MQYRVMATILETVDNPEDAATPCRVCIEELNSLSAVQNSFDVRLKKGIQAVRSLFGKNERSKIISSVCHINRVICDVTQTVGKDVLWICPIDIGEDKVDPLRDERVAKVLSKQGMEYCLVTPWSFGQEGKKEHKLKYPIGIATNSSGQFIVGEESANGVKIFDPCGQFIQHLSLPNDDAERKLYIRDVATDNKDNIYVLGSEKKTGSEGFVVYEFSNTADLHHKFPVRRGYWRRLTVTNSKVLLLTYSGVAVYDTVGRFVRSFGEEALENACDITAANDGRVMVMVVMNQCDSCVHIFSEDGDYLGKFERQRRNYFRYIAFHRASEHVVITSDHGPLYISDFVHVAIFTKDGVFVRSTQIHERNRGSGCMTVTKDGRIAVLVREIHYSWKVLVI